MKNEPCNTIKAVLLGGKGGGVVAPNNWGEGEIYVIK